MSPERITHSQVVKAACISGTSASVASAIALAVCGERDEGSPAGPINGPSQWLWGEREAHTREATWRHTAVGYAIHHTMSIAWAVLYERAFGSGRETKSNLRIATEATALVAVAFAVDYGCTPRRLRPGFRKHLKRRSIFAVYASFAVGLTLASVVRARFCRPRAF